MKQKAKKSAASHKFQLSGTGGGPSIPQLDTIDEKILTLLGNRATPLSNLFDSDAAYNNEAGQ